MKPIICKWGKKNFVNNFHVVDTEDHPVLLGLSTLRYLGLFVELPLVFIEAVKIRPVHMVKMSGTQKKKKVHKIWKGHQRCLRLGTCFAQYLPVRIFARGTCQKHRNDAS